MVKKEQDQVPNTRKSIYFSLWPLYKLQLPLHDVHEHFIMKRNALTSILLH